MSLSEEAGFYKEYYIKLYFKIIFSWGKTRQPHTSSLVPLMPGNCTTRRTSYTRAIFSSFLWRAPSSSSLRWKVAFRLFAPGEKFDPGDWKALCGATCRRCLANNPEVTRRFCLFSGVSVTSRPLLRVSISRRDEKPSLFYATTPLLRAGDARSSRVFLPAFMRITCTDRTHDPRAFPAPRKYVNAFIWKYAPF